MHCKHTLSRKGHIVSINLLSQSTFRNRDNHEKLGVAENVYMSKGTNGIVAYPVIIWIFHP